MEQASWEPNVMGHIPPTRIISQLLVYCSFENGLNVMFVDT